VVLRDHHGGFVAGASHFFPSACDAERTELLARRRAAELATEMGALKLILESDCMGAVAKLKSTEKDRSIHGPLVEEIKVLLRGFDDHVVKQVRRSGNGAAHRLAKFSCDNKSCNRWIGVPPDFLVDLLAKDSGVY
jgi:hypothetical protein